MCDRWSDPAYVSAAADRDASPVDPRDAFPDVGRDASRLEHARRTAGRPRGVVYTEPEDTAPPAVCYCHGDPVCPDYLAAMYDEARDPSPYRDGEPWP